MNRWYWFWKIQTTHTHTPFSTETISHRFFIQINHNNSKWTQMCHVGEQRHRDVIFFFSSSFFLATQWRARTWEGQNTRRRCQLGATLIELSLSSSSSIWRSGLRAGGGTSVTLPSRTSSPRSRRPLCISVKKRWRWIPARALDLGKNWGWRTCVQLIPQ